MLKAGKINEKDLKRLKMHCSCRRKCATDRQILRLPDKICRQQWKGLGKKPATMLTAHLLYSYSASFMKNIQYTDIQDEPEYQLQTGVSWGTV